MSLKSFKHIGKGRDLTTEEQGKFYNSMKSCVWLLKVGVGSNMKVASGVCIQETGLVLTSSSVVGSDDTPVFGREASSSNFHRLEIRNSGKTLVVLEPSYKKKEGYDYADIADDSTQFTDCQEVYSIFHNRLGVYSFAVGELSNRRRMIDEVPHFQVANVHSNGGSDIIFDSTGCIIGMVIRRPSSGENNQNPHNLALHSSEINKFVKSCSNQRVSRSSKR